MRGGSFLHEIDLGPLHQRMTTLFMKLLLHTDFINERGVAASTFEYAVNLQRLGYQVSWLYQKDSSNNDFRTIEHYEQFVELRGYKKFQAETSRLSCDFDWAYFQKQGTNDGLAIKRIPNNVHVVFNIFDPHGDNYAYISQWLAAHAGYFSNSSNRLLSGLRRRVANPISRNSFVPYCLDLPKLDEDFRRDWRIPQDAFVCTTMGGETSFDISWVQKTIIELLEERNDFYFVGINTRPFTSHKRSLFLERITGKANKVRALRSSSVFLHGRTIGESFGMTILEAMAVGIPILSWKGGRDRNHISLLDNECLYRDASHLKNKLFNLPSNESIKINLKTAETYQSINVMPRFIKTFGLK